MEWRARELVLLFVFFFSSRRRHTRFDCDWSSDVCSSDLNKLGFTLLGVNVEPDSQAADDWLKQTPVSFPILYDKESTVSRLFDVAGMPSTVIIDRKGKVRMLHKGYKPGDENEYLDSIRSLVRE